MRKMMDGLVAEWKAMHRPTMKELARKTARTVSVAAIAAAALSLADGGLSALSRLLTGGAG